MKMGRKGKGKTDEALPQIDISGDATDLHLLQFVAIRRQVVKRTVLY